MITDETIEKIAKQKNLPKEKIEQALIEMSNGKENKKSILELLEEIPEDKIKNDFEFKKIYEKLKQIFE